MHPELPDELERAVTPACHPAGDRRRAAVAAGPDAAAGGAPACAPPPPSARGGAYRVAAAVAAAGSGLRGAGHEPARLPHARRRNPGSAARYAHSYAAALGD